jgi:hypothetical protein
MSPTERSQARIYRLLLAAYPPEFRERFEDEMVQLFVDQLRAARTGAGGQGTGRTWIRSVSDLAVTALSERARRGRTAGHSLPAGPSLPNRLLGLLGILGGLLLVAAFVPNLPWTSELFNLRLVLLNIGAIAVAVAMHRQMAEVSRRLSLAIMLTVIVANVWYLGMIVIGLDRPRFPEPDPEFRLVFFFAGGAMWLADAVFGVSTWRLRTATRWGAVLLAIGSVLAFAGMDRLELVNGDLAWLVQPLALLGIALNGIGWILLGFDVAFRQRAARPSPRGAPGLPG